MSEDPFDDGVDVVESLDELEELLESRYDDEFDLEGTVTIRKFGPDDELKEKRVVEL